jgi:hypothetical protein
MINLYDNETGEQYGAINDDQFQFLVDQLEEESLEDRDYAITAMTIAYLAEQGADACLVEVLQTALSDREEVVVRWARS